MLILSLALLPMVSTASEGPAVLVLRFDDWDGTGLPVSETLAMWLESVFSEDEDISVRVSNLCVPIHDGCIPEVVEIGSDEGADIVMFGSFFDDGSIVKLALISVISTDDIGLGRNEVSFIFEESHALPTSLFSQDSEVPPSFAFTVNTAVADWMLSQDRLQECSVLLGKALDHADSVPDEYQLNACEIKGLIDRELGLYQQAIDVLTEALQLDPSSTDNLCIRASCYDALDSMELAVNDLKDAIELDPDDAGINAQLGAQLVQAGREDEAQQYLDRSIELDPFCAMTYRDRARSFFRMGMYEAGMSYINSAVRLDPEDPQGRAMRAILLYFTGRIGESLEEYTTAIELEENPEVLAWNYYGRANCYIDQGDYRSALEDLLTAQGYSGSSYTVLYLTGVCYNELGYTDNAEMYLTSYLSHPLELNPVDPWTTADLHIKAQELLEEIQDR